MHNKLGYYWYVNDVLIAEFSPLKNTLFIGGVFFLSPTSSRTPKCAIVKTGSTDMKNTGSKWTFFLPSCFPIPQGDAITRAFQYVWPGQCSPVKNATQNLSHSFKKHFNVAATYALWRRRDVRYDTHLGFCNQLLQQWFRSESYQWLWATYIFSIPTDSDCYASKNDCSLVVGN